VAHLILVVDDYEPQLHARAATLRAAGFDVLQARRGREALELARERHPHLVVLDVALPDIDGMEVCRAIKADAATADMLVLHASAAFIDPATRVEALTNGADGYLVEPLAPEELVAQVRALLRGRDAEFEARATRALLERVVEGSPAPIAVVTGPDLRFTLANPAFERIAGAAVAGRTAADVFPEAATSPLLPCLRDVVEKGGSHVLRELRITAPGVDAWWDAELIPLPDPAGGARGALVLGWDVTARKHAEEAARAREARERQQREFLECMIAHAGSAIAVIQGRELRHVLVNTAYQAIAPGTPMLGRTYREVFPEAADAGTEARLRHVLETAEPWAVDAYPAPIPGKPDATWEGHVVQVPAPAGDEPAVLAVISDITERVRAETARRESDERYRRLFESMSEGCVVGRMIDDERGRPCDYQLLEVNPAFERLTGLPRAEALRKTITQLIPTLEPEWIDHHARVARTGEPLHWTAYNAHVGRHYEMYSFSPGPGLFASLFVDVTERTRAAEVLAQSESRLAAAVNVAQLGVWEYDVPAGRSHYDARCREVFGIADDRPLTDEEIFELVHPDDRARVRQQVQRALDPFGPGVYESEYRVARTDGTVRWVAVRGHAVGPVDAVGWRRVAGTLMDITERKTAEQALGAQTQLLAAIVDNIPVLLAIWDSALQSFRFNRHLRETLGWTEADTVDGRFMERVYPDPDYRRAVSEYMLSLERGYRDLKTTAKDGTAIDIAWANVSLPDGSSIGIGIDIRERKAMEAALERSARMLHGIMEHVPEGISICDADGRFIMSSRASLALSGRAPGHDAPAYLKRHRVFAADGRTPVPDAQVPLIRALRRGEVVIGEELVLERADGIRLSILANAAPMRDEGGAIVGAVLAYQDIGARKRMEEALRESDRRKDEFIAILSHELRNPLAPIRYAVPVLQQEPLGESAGRALAVIDRQVAHLARLVDDLLDVSRITRGKIELRREHVTLTSIVTASVEASSPAIAAGSHTLRLDVGEEPVWLHVDPARMAQVVANLLVNSAKYTPRGGEIRLEARREREHAVIRVADNGVGIAPDVLPVIFELFRQVNAPDGHGGLGIGLALVERLVQLHEGTVEARSAGPGQGAEFVVRVPAAQPASAAGVGAQHAVAAPGSTTRLRVLVVDDNVDLVEMLAMVIEGAGHEVRKAFDGRSAVDVALAYRPDVAFLDLGLPAMSGTEVARELRSRPEMASTRLVALTGWGQLEDRRRTADAGFDHHLTKPTEPETLERLLQALATRGAVS
jgi:PAS domain S-box-containing protein